MNAWPYRPGVPAAGHVTGSGYWHPGAVEGCTKCAPAPSRFVRRGVEFTHPRMKDLAWKPDVAAGEKYADAPGARCVITAVRGRSVYFRYAESSGARGTFTASLADVERWVRDEHGRPRP